MHIADLQELDLVNVGAFFGRQCWYLGQSSTAQVKCGGDVEFYPKFCHEEGRWSGLGLKHSAKTGRRRERCVKMQPSL